LLNLERARRDTPACARVAHLNNAGAALSPQPVVDEVVDYLRLEAEIGGYETAARELDRLRRPYTAAAAMLNCDAEEIAVVESATRAWQLAFAAIPLAPGDRVLTSMAEYGTNYMGLLHAVAHRGIVVDVVPDDDDGRLSVEALREMIDERVKLVAVTHVPTNGGLVNPAAAIGAVTREHGITYLLDACQSVGQLPVDVEEVGCDFLGTTSRKYLRGPRGVGILYVRRSQWDRLVPALPDIKSADWIDAGHYRHHPGPRGFETYEISHAAKAGLGVALEYALDIGIHAIWERVRRLGDDLRAGLAAVDGVTVHDLGTQRCGIVTFAVRGHDPAAVRVALSAAGVNVWTTDAPATRLDMDRRGLASLVRASVHYYNTDDELARCCEGVAALT